ncbi:hypothetical protein ACR2WD_27365, partial [Klebsiella pneumoniae]
VVLARRAVVVEAIPGEPTPVTSKLAAFVGGRWGRSEGEGIFGVGLVFDLFRYVFTFLVDEENAVSAAEARTEDVGLADVAYDLVLLEELVLVEGVAVAEVGDLLWGGRGYGVGGGAGGVVVVAALVEDTFGLAGGLVVEPHRELLLGLLGIVVNYVALAVVGFFSNSAPVPLVVI